MDHEKRKRTRKTRKGERGSANPAGTPGRGHPVSPSQRVATDDVEPPRPLEEAPVLVAQAEEARAEAALGAVLRRLDFGNWRET